MVWFLLSSPWSLQEKEHDLSVAKLVQEHGDNVTTDDFELLKVLGQGSFGKVSNCHFPLV